MVTALTLLAAGSVYAGQAAPPAPTPAPPLTLPQATAMAIQNHPQIAAAQNTAAAAGQHITEAKAAHYPTIDGELTESQGLYGSRLGAGALSSSALFSRIGQGIQLTQLVTDFGRTNNLIAQSQYQAQAADAGTQATIYDVVLGVNRAWFEVLMTKAYVTVATETVRTRQTLTDQVTALANANLKSQVDVSFAGVNLSEAKLLLIRSQDAIDRAYSDLARALGQDQEIHYQLAEGPSPGPPPDSPEPLITEAVQNRPELRNLQLQFQGAQSFEQAEADLSRPNVSVIGVGGALPYLDQNPRVAPHEYEGIALNVDIPIFNGHLFAARRQAAHYEAQAASERVRDLRQQVESDVRAAWISASTAYQRIPVTEQLIQQAQLALVLAQGRYNLGLDSIVEITQAQLNVTQAQIENVSAKYDYQSAYAQLQYTIGALR
jgi:outer membrane protein